MTQNNPSLSLNQQGKDVALLQSRLIKMGYILLRSAILNEFLGESTQRAEGLPISTFHQSTGAVVWQQELAQAQSKSQTKVDALRLGSKLSAKALDLSPCYRSHHELKIHLSKKFSLCVLVVALSQ